MPTRGHVVGLDSEKISYLFSFPRGQLRLTLNLKTEKIVIILFSLVQKGPAPSHLTLFTIIRYKMERVSKYIS